MPNPGATLPLAVDVMGGDLGPKVQVEGAVQAAQQWNLASILVGRSEEISSLLAGLGGSSLPIEIVDAPQVITMEDSPARAVRRKANSSLCVAYRLIEDGRASGMLSSGNSGAMMAAGTMICGLLPGIERPAITTLMPVEGNSTPNVILDVGANVDCHAHNLVQFALMGAIYHSSLFQSTRPTIALLSNGSEPGKGTDKIRTASMILSQLPSCNYVGYVEGRDVLTPKANVVVCDGFVGNVLLKALEGCVRFVAHQIKDEGSRGDVMSRLGLFLSKGLLRRLFYEKFDYSSYGGAPLLGLKKLAVVLHGSSDERAVKNAIRFGYSFVESRMTERIASALAQLEEDLAQLDGVSISGLFQRERETVVHERDESEPQEVSPTERTERLIHEE